MDELKEQGRGKLLRREDHIYIEAVTLWQFNGKELSSYKSNEAKQE